MQENISDLSLLDVLQNNASTVLESINQAVSHFSNSILSSLANIISVIPTLFMQTIITIIRNIVEPKLIGKQIGLHPVLTFISMLTGLRFLGIWGLFGFPIAISFIKKLNDNGTIHVFK